jgi:hypothetical protein
MTEKNVEYVHELPINRKGERNRAWDDPAWRRGVLERAAEKLAEKDKPAPERRMLPSWM